MPQPLLSVVVSSYGREKYLRALIESVQTACPVGQAEIIVVCSDPPESDKIKWLRQEQGVHLIRADERRDRRLRSLYHYENLGIKSALGEWIFVTNDDTTLDPYFFANLLKYETSYTADVILVNGHVGEVGLGARIPVIGTLRRPGDRLDSPLYLYDFSIIRKWVYEEIGSLDENIDWFGKGWDLALACEFIATAKSAHILHSSNLLVNHAIAPENRVSMQAGNDFTYIQNKWNKWCANHPGYAYTCPW